MKQRLLCRQLGGGLADIGLDRGARLGAIALCQGLQHQGVVVQEVGRAEIRIHVMQEGPICSQSVSTIDIACGMRAAM